MPKKKKKEKAGSPASSEEEEPTGGDGFLMPEDIEADSEARRAPKKPAVLGRVGLPARRGGVPLALRAYANRAAGVRGRGHRGQAEEEKALWHPFAARRRQRRRAGSAQEQAVLSHSRLAVRRHNSQLQLRGRGCARDRLKRSRASSVAAARMPVIILRGPLQFMCIL